MIRCADADLLLAAFNATVRLYTLQRSFPSFHWPIFWQQLHHLPGSLWGLVWRCSPLERCHPLPTETTFYTTHIFILVHDVGKFK